MENTRKKVDEAKKKLYARVDAIYAGKGCDTAAQLIEFADHEPFDLMELQQQAYNFVRTACYEGMEADGIEYPEILWARKVDLEYEYPVFKQIRDQAVNIKTQPAGRDEHSSDSHSQEKRRASSYAEKGGADSAKRAAGMGIAGVGTVTAAYSLLADVSILLTGLGIAMAVGGILIIVSGTKNVNRESGGARRTSNDSVSRSTGAPHGASREVSEQKQVHDVLSKMSEVNKEVIDDWCSDVLKLVEAAAAADKG